MNEAADMKKTIAEQKERQEAAAKNVILAIDSVAQSRTEKRDESTRRY